MKTRNEFPPDWESARAHTQLGRKFAALGKTSRAMSLFETAIEIDPSYADAYFAAGDALLAAGSYSESARYYRKGLNHSHRNAPVFVSLGNCYYRMGAYVEAEMAYRQALAIRPDYPEAEECLSMTEEAQFQRKAA